MSVLSEALHSSLDILSAGVAFFTVRIAGKPADEDHPFGHGKIETLSSLFESAMLVVVAAYVVRESYYRFQEPRPVEYQGLAIGVMIVALIASYIVYHHNSRAARVADSSALQVNAIHYLFDVISGIAVLGGLILMQLTAWPLWDPIMGAVVGLYIAGMAITQVIGALRELADTRLPESEFREMNAIVDTFKSADRDGIRIIDAHDWRTRKSGPARHVDFHMSVCKELSVRESHDLCDEIERKIEERFPNVSVTIHVEPCDLHVRGDCELPCERAHAHAQASETKD